MPAADFADSPTSSTSTLQGDREVLGAGSRNMTEKGEDIKEKDFAASEIGTTMPAEAARANVGECGPSVGQVDEKDTPATVRGSDGTEKERDLAQGVTDAETVEMIDGRPKDIYDRFTNAQKRRILLIVSFSAIIAPMTSSIFLPSIPQMSEDLGTTASVINYTVAVFIVVIGIAPVLWSPYAGFYGRRPVYLASMPIMVVASIGVAFSNNVAALTGTRILQGIGSSCFLSVGAGSVGDIYRPTERARGMAGFYMVVLLGPAISPVIAGIFSEYTSTTWRTSQYFIAGMGALSVVLTFVFLPETSHPPLPHETLKKEKGKKFVWYWCNPFRSLALLLWPNILLITLVSSCGMVNTYVMLVPLSAVFKDRYNINNLALSGCLYLSNGAGNILGSRIAGPMADKTVKKWIEKRGYRRPEDRLRAAYFGMGILMPASILVYGWVVEKNAGGIAPPLVMVFLNGLALSLVSCRILVDSMQTRSAEVIAVNNCIRYIFAAVASAVVLPIAHAIGWGPTGTICFVITMCAAFMLFLCERYGDKWREAANKRYGMTKREADEEHVDAGTDEESAARVDGDPSPTDRKSEESHHGEHDEHPAQLERKGTEGKAGRQRAMSGSSRIGARPELARRETKGEMPPVTQVLSRTVSLSGASVHGGG
ncbi:hypothetical protein IAU60_005526 [Kwoniella sp. DSM 27419]